jgi:hypothetical protein
LFPTEEKTVIADPDHVLRTLKNLTEKAVASATNCDKIMSQVFLDDFGPCRIDAVEGPHGITHFRFRLVTEEICDIDSWFWAAETLTTQEQWVAIMGSNPSYFLGDVRRPVEQVSLEDVDKFLEFFNVDKSKSLYVLPTEIMWERLSEFEDTAIPLNQRAWMYENDGTSTHPVGMLAPNKLGVYDVLGNVWEYMRPETRISDYPYATGGCWWSDEKFVRPNFRLQSFKELNSTVGFRVYANIRV